VQQNKLGEQKYLRLFGHFSITILLLGTLLNAQSFAEFKRYNEKSFSKYKDERDIAFSKNLKHQFEAYKSKQNKPFYDKKKPSIIKKANSKPVQLAGPTISIKLPEVKVPVVKNKDNKEKVSQDKDINIDFFGTKIELNIDSVIKTAEFHPKNQHGINNFFDIVASSDYEYFIKDIDKISNKLNLNAWGIYLLVKQISESALSNKDNSKLLTWFILSKMGYKVKIGLSSKHIILMHYSKKNIYAKTLYNFNNEMYFVLSSNNNMNKSRVFSYKYDYPDATKDLDLSLKTLPTFEIDLRKKSLKFSVNAKKHTINYEYNQNLINFMDTYPQADYETFFNAPLDSITYRGLATSIKEMLDYKQASTAINFILNFVQNAFVYEVDNKQFGYEKVMFAQETLYYDKSDCEDRAILFSYLVTKLFSYSVVGIKYKDHMATAIYIPIKGDSVNIKSKKYIIADPTYLNASVGQSMPQYRSIKPDKFIKVFKK
jgi:hypothetical protein